MIYHHHFINNVLISKHCHKNSYITYINGMAKGGPDDISPSFYKQCSNQLALP